MRSCAPTRFRSSRAPRRLGRLVALAAAPLVAAGIALAPGAQAAPAASPVRAAAPAAGGVTIPATCRTAVTLVRPDRSLAVGAVTGTKAALYPSGVTLAFAPTTLAYLGTSRNRGIAIDRYLGIDTSGALHLLTVTDRRAARGAVSLDDRTLAGGWGSIRSLTYGGLYLYGLTTDGGLKRYRLDAQFKPRSAGVVGTRGYGSIRSLGSGGWWRLPGGKAADDLVGTTTAGALMAYSVPRDAPTRVTSARLGASGWGSVAHVAVGQCATGPARPLVAITTGGDVRVYLDRNGNDQRGTDIAFAGRAATGWTGLAGD